MAGMRELLPVSEVGALTDPHHVPKKAPASYPGNVKSMLG